MIKFLTVTCALVLGQAVHAEGLLVKLASPSSVHSTVQIMNSKGLKASAVSDSWIEVSGNVKLSQFKGFLESGAVLHAQPNFKVHTFENPALTNLRKNPAALAKIVAAVKANGSSLRAQVDNPEIPNAPFASPGTDPLFAKQWGMSDIGVANAWKLAPVTNDIVVAVIDTGVDYTHEDLVGNMWHNPKEIAGNGIDDDRNGYVDDIVGWDFLGKDNKPYDMAGSLMDIILKGANPGHGTHCAGNVAAVGNNSVGISGVAPAAKIMALRFIGSEGGTTADAILAIRYAVDNGAKVLSNSWGSEGEDPNDAATNLALKEAIQYAQYHDVLFIAAAGNGHQGKGYDNDTDAKPGVPASYDNDNIISVAAIDSADALGSFSNWGARTVDIAAPGVKVFSTVVQSSKYADGIGFAGFSIAGWDGTSMATPHVAGAAALYWSAHPTKSWSEVKSAILSSVKPIAAAQGKMTSNGKLNVEALMKY
jgi:thermitase